MLPAVDPQHRVARERDVDLLLARIDRSVLGVAVVRVLVEARRQVEDLHPPRRDAEGGAGPGHEPVVERLHLVEALDRGIRHGESPLALRWSHLLRSSHRPGFIARVRLVLCRPLPENGVNGRKMTSSRRARWGRRLVGIAVLSLGLLVPGGTGHARATASGTVVAWGCIGQYADQGQCSVPSGLSGVTAIAAGEGNGLALKSDGTVVAWGCKGIGAGPCTVPSGLSGVTAIAAGGGHSLALKSDGTVVAWGCTGFDHGQCNVGGITGATDVAAGTHHSLILKRDGTVVAAGCGMLFGFGDFGQCNVPAGLSGVSAVAASTTYSLALIGPRKQTIAFAPLPNKTFGDPDFTVSATASSGLPVSFAASGHCTVSRAKVHLTGAGSCTITASQAGNANWRPAPPVAQTFSIAPAPCRVPKVTGKRLPAAKAAIVRRHCRTGKIGHAYSSKHKGIVVSQSRKAGLVLPPNAKINLVVSRGRKR